MLFVGSLNELRGQGTLVTKFDMTLAWDDAMTLLRTERSLFLVIAGAFLFLPSLAFAVIGPVPTEPPPAADFMVQLQAMNKDFRNMLPWLVGVSIVASIGGVAILRLWLAETGISVAEAIGFAAALLPALIAVFVIQGLATGIAAFALILPAFYLTGRLAPVLPIFAAGEARGPIEALIKAWTLTQGNGWRIALMLILIQFVVILLSFLIEGFGGIMGERGSPGAIVAGAASALLSTGAALVGYAVCAAVFRQLSFRERIRPFE